MGIPETLSVRTEHDHVHIRILIGEDDVLFEIRSPMSALDSIPPALLPPAQPAPEKEYLLSFDFDTADDPRSAGMVLQRLDTHVTGLTVGEHDDGHLITGEVTAWVAYTGAHPEPDASD